MNKGTRAALCAIGAIGALAIAPSAALAAQCSLGSGSTDELLDSGGYVVDISQDVQTTPGNIDEQDFATLDDGGASTTSTPAGPRSGNDSWDGWGALFVGPGGDASLANQYFSPDDNSCVYEDGGRTVAFPVLTLGGLTVQRRISVPASGLPGARLIDTLVNRTGKPITTAVQVGDTQSDDNYGDVGSDGSTAVRASSSGDLAATPADTWFVTSDGATTNGDLALAHLMGGPGGRDPVDFVTLTGLPGEDPADNAAWRWDNVQVQPGQTVTFASASIQQGVAGAASAAETALASATAAGYQAAPLGEAFPALSGTELAAVANWATPFKCGGRAVTIAGSDVRDVIVGTKKPDVIFAGGGNDKVLGKKGNDRICGGPGKDKLIGGKGKKDLLKGGGGKDIERQ